MIQYVDYKRWLDGTLYALPPENPSKSPTPKLSPAKNISKTKKNLVPHSAGPATRKALAGLLWIGLFLVFSGWYNVALVLSDRYMTFSFPYRVWILQLLGFTSRMKYYGVWSLTEGACIMAGISYNGIDEKTGHAKWGKSSKTIRACQWSCHHSPTVLLTHAQTTSKTSLPLASNSPKTPAPTSTTGTKTPTNGSETTSTFASHPPAASPASAPPSPHSSPPHSGTASTRAITSHSFWRHLYRPWRRTFEDISGRFS